MDETLATDATYLLQKLIRFNTVNPPGNEREAIEYLAAILRDGGFEVTVVGRTPERPNLVAELKSRDGNDGPVLGLLSHVDTVLAEPGDWKHDPWSGEVHKEVIWGRGAIDMKSQTAANVTAALNLAGQGWRPEHGSLKVIVVSDEETGGEEGAVWLCEHEPDLARCDLMLNEGGGAPFVFDDDRFYGVCVGEKGPDRFVIKAGGHAAHAATPGLGDNALLRLVPLIDKLASAENPVCLIPATERLLRSLVPDAESPEAALLKLRTEAPQLAAALEPMVRVTFAPTRISASDKINVIPDRAELRVDCRVPPGVSHEQVEAMVLAAIGPLPEEIEIEWTERVPGNYSPAEGQLWDALVDWLDQKAAEATVVPTILPGFTDSRTWRSAFPDCVAYGFFPHKEIELSEQAGLMHAANERIHIADLEFATECYRDVILRVLGA